jgi:Tfp pilus assembly protein FimV
MCFFCSAHTDSKRIEVYAAGLTYWDVRPGETLGEIVSQLLPNNQARRKSLQAEIIKLNPAAFSDYNADFLKANVRLWLPGHSQGLNRKINKDKYSIREFSWGYIQTRKQY